MSKPIDQELLPCPFCGSKKLKRRSDDALYWVECQKCFATGPAHSRHDESDPWQARAAVQPAGVAVPDMPPTQDRRPYDDEEPDGYLEGNNNWAENNNDAVEWLADNHAAIRLALAAAPHPVSGEQKTEEPTIVGVRVSSDGFGSYIADSSMGLGALYPGDVREPLMTVSQHNRIIEALAAHRAQQGEQPS